MRVASWFHLLLSASVLPAVNRWRRGSRGYRWLCVVACVVVSCAAAASVAWVADHGPDPTRALPAWLAGLGAAGVAAVFAAGRRRRSDRRHGMGWMQAWPIDGRALACWSCLRSGLAVFAWMTWPAWLAGRAWVAGDGVWLVLVGCAAGAMVGAWAGGRWPVPGEARGDAAPPLATRDVPSPPFLGLAQLQHWQRRAIGRVGLRRWAKWAGLLLLSFPSASIGLRGVVQLLLLLLVWPLYARAMRSSLSTVFEASRLLAATPLPRRAWLHRLLPTPGMLAVGLAAALAADMAWMHQPARTVAAMALLVLAVEGWRLGYGWWRSRAFRDAREPWPGGTP
jgi:hypothetical protein